MSLPKVAAPAAETVTSGIDELLHAANLTVRELMDSCRPDDPMQGQLARVQQTVERLAALAAQLHPTGRTKAVRATPLDLNSVVQKMSVPLQRLLGPFISLETVLHSPGLWIAGDRGQIEQVALGLVISAREALPLGGVVSVSTRHRMLDRQQDYRIGSLGPGDWAVLEVRDNGAGIDERLVHHLIDPPERTMPVDSTLGLGAVASIVREAAGQMILDTTRGAGTALAACFPRVVPPRSRQPATGTANAIMIVDDDVWSRLSAATALRRAGYGVLEAEHAEAALELLDDVAGSCVRLVLMDARIAAAGSEPLGGRLKRERPEIELILTAPVAASFTAPNQVVLQKPFQSEALLNTVGQRFSVSA